MNRVAYALPAEISPVAAPPCPGCGAAIPVIRLWSRLCGVCGERQAYDRLEWLLAGSFALLALRFGMGGQLVAYSLYTAALGVTAAIDLRYRYIYSIVTAPALLIALVLSPSQTGLDLHDTLLGVAVGVGLFGAFYLIGRLLYRDREPVGKGDIELAAVIGAMVGFPRVVSALFLGSFANGLVIVVLLLARRKGRMDFIPYGPGLCLGAFTTFFMTP